MNLVIKSYRIENYAKKGSDLECNSMVMQKGSEDSPTEAELCATCSSANTFDSFTWNRICFEDFSNSLVSQQNK